MPDLKRPNPDDANALVLAKKSRTNEVVLAKVQNAGALVPSSVSALMLTGKSISRLRLLNKVIGVFNLIEVEDVYVIL